MLSLDAEKVGAIIPYAAPVSEALQFYLTGGKAWIDDDNNGNTIPSKLTIQSQPAGVISVKYRMWVYLNC